MELAKLIKTEFRQPIILTIYKKLKSLELRSINEVSINNFDKYNLDLSE